MSKPKRIGNWARCKTAMSLSVTGSDRAEHLWPGLVVNLDRELAPGYTIGQALAGREDCFELSEAPGEEAETVLSRDAVRQTVTSARLPREQE